MIALELEMPDLVRLMDARLDEWTASRSDAPATTGTASPAPSARSVQQRPVAGVSFAMILEGEYWTVTGGAGRTFRLKDSLGLQYLARLLAEPGREIHVLDLVAGGTGGGGADDQPVDSGDAGELLDDEARAEYRRRLEDLRDTLAEAESFGDAARAARAREEIDFLGAELGRAVGLGRSRPARGIGGGTRAQRRSAAHQERPRPHRRSRSGPGAGPGANHPNREFLRLSSRSSLALRFPGIFRA